MAKPSDEIDDCRSLFLTEIQESDFNSLRVVVVEGLPAGEPQSILVGDATISDCTPIEPTDKSRVFELVWPRYVGYSVLNESYASVSEDEQYQGRRFRLYSSSRFLDYMSHATFACNEYPGPTRHYCLACEDHIIHVLALGGPTVTRLQ